MIFLLKNMKNSEIQQASFCLLSEIHSTVHRGTFKISFLVSIRLTNVAGKARMMATADRTHTTSLDISCQLCFTCSRNREMSFYASTFWELKYIYLLLNFYKEMFCRNVDFFSPKRAFYC
jgi:hypothetical protein